MKKKMIIIMLSFFVLSSCGKSDLIGKYSKKIIDIYNKEISFLEKNNLIYIKDNGIELGDNFDNNKLNIELFCNIEKKCVLILGKDKLYRNNSIYKAREKLKKNINKLVSGLIDSYNESNFLHKNFNTLGDYFNKSIKDYTERLREKVNGSNYLLDHDKNISVKDCKKVDVVYYSTKNQKEFVQLLKYKKYLSYNIKKNNNILSIYDCSNSNSITNKDNNIIFVYKDKLYILYKGVFDNDFYISFFGLKKKKKLDKRKKQISGINIVEKLITNRSSGSHPEISLDGNRICYSKSKIIHKKKISLFSDEEYIYEYNSKIYINNKEIVYLTPGKLISCKLENGKFIILTYNGKTKNGKVVNNMYFEDNDVPLLGSKCYAKIASKLLSSTFSPKKIVDNNGNIIVSYVKEGNYLRFFNNELYYLNGYDINSISMYFNKEKNEGKILYSVKEGNIGYNSLYLLQFKIK